MRAFLILATLSLTLTACGADGPPVAPAPEPVVSITGEAAVGVSTKIN